MSDAAFSAREQVSRVVHVQRNSPWRWSQELAHEPRFALCAHGQHEHDVEAVHVAVQGHIAMLALADHQLALAVVGRLPDQALAVRSRLVTLRYRVASRETPARRGGSAGRWPVSWHARHRG